MERAVVNVGWERTRDKETDQQREQVCTHNQSDVSMSMADPHCLFAWEEAITALSKPKAWVIIIDLLKHLKKNTVICFWGHNHYFTPADSSSFQSLNFIKLYSRPLWKFGFIWSLKHWSKQYVISELCLRCNTIVESRQIDCAYQMLIHGGFYLITYCVKIWEM